MSKCFDLYIERAKSDTSKYKDRDWTKAEEVKAKKVFNYAKRTFGLSPKDNVQIVFDENVELDYFSSQSCCHDGTILFELETYMEIVARIVTGKSYFISKGEPQKYTKYTIGNFVCLNEYGNFGTEEKPWMHQRTTIMLPVKYETWGD